MDGNLFSEKSELSRNDVRQLLRKKALHPLSVLTACLFVCSAVLLLLTANLGTAAEWEARMLSLGITDPDARSVWLILRAALHLLAFADAGCMAFLLLSAAASARRESVSAVCVKPARVMSTLLRYVLLALFVLLPALFLYRFIRFIVLNSGTEAGTIRILAMLGAEPISAVICFLLLWRLTLCIRDAADTLDGLSYMILLEKPDPQALSSRVVRFRWLFALLLTVLLLFEGFLCGLAFGLCAAASALTAILLDRLKADLERPKTES